MLIKKNDFCFTLKKKSLRGEYINESISGYFSACGFACDAADDSDLDRKINRQNFAAGWFMTENVVIKLEYVNEEREGDGFNNSKYQGAKWNGIMLEAAISF